MCTAPLSIFFKNIFCKIVRYWFSICFNSVIERRFSPIPLRGGGEKLDGSFDKFLEEYFMSVLKHGVEMPEAGTDFDDVEIEILYRRLVDKLVIRMFENMVENALIQCEFRKLTNRQRMVILLNVLMKIKPKTTADMIGSTIDNVYQHKSRALQKLRKELQDLADS
jgi:predicted ATPase